MQSGKKLAKTFLPTLFCLLSMLLVACGGGSNSTGPTSTGVTKAPANQQIYVDPEEGVSDLKQFDPAMAGDLRSIGAIGLVFTGLVELNDNLQVIDQLAASHQVAADGVTWTFKLRPDLKFSDGTPLTSTDVAYSIDRALDPALKSGVAPAYLSLIKDSDKRNAGQIKTLVGDSILTPDPQTVVIVTNKKAAYFLDTLTYNTSYVVEKKLIDKYGNTAWTDHLNEGGGAGPWMVSKYAHGQEIDFVPNPYYYGKKPQLKKLIYPFYRQSDTSYKAYQVGQVSTAGVPNAQLDSAKALPNKQYHEVPSLDVYYFGMNYLAKPFDNIKIRQAFALALNKDSIAHNIYKDTIIPTNHIVPQGMPGYNPNLTGPDGVKGTAGDPTQAKQLFQQGLQEEGMTLATLPQITVEVSSEGSADARNEFSTEQQMWQSTLGVTVKINDVDFSKLLDDIDGALNNPKGLMMWQVDWIADYPDPQDWTTLQFDKGAPNNQINYGQNHSADAAQQQATQQLLEQADVNPDPNARLQQYMQAEQQLVNDVAWLPIYQATSSIVRKPCVVGYVDTPGLMTPPDDWANVYISTATPCANTSAYQ
jgi:oligopeptide transport system substrate-binding protein